MTDEVTPDLIGTAELAVLNAAQTILVRIREDAVKRGYAAMRSEAYDPSEANALDFSKAATMAEHATGAVFDLLNVVNSHRIQAIPYRNLHNREPEVAGEPVA